MRSSPELDEVARGGGRADQSQSWRDDRRWLVKVWNGEEM